MRYWILSVWVLAALAPFALAQNQAETPALVETAPSPSNSARDVAIWVNQVDAARSNVLVADDSVGLIVYDLEGNEQQRVTNFGPMNSVDLRSGVFLDGQLTTLVVASINGDNSFALLQADDATGDIAPIGVVDTVNTLTGVCLYQATGETFIFSVSTNGAMEQFALVNGAGVLEATAVREMRVGSALASCAADDELGHVYVAEASVAIWRLSADPGAGDEREVVDLVGQSITEQVGGLALYDAERGDGYLLAANQQNSSILVYERGDQNSLVGEFNIVGADGTDSVTEPTGIAVVGDTLNNRFAQGLFATTDATNEDPLANNNVKLVHWQDVASALGLP